MFGRIFGRDKEDAERASCAECGRTLLAGEWTRKVTGPNGEDQLICSLCGPDHPLDEDVPPDAAATPANNGRVRETREDAPLPQLASDLAGGFAAKDAEIAELRERLALSEARNEELAFEVALLRRDAAADDVASAPTNADDAVSAPTIVGDVVSAPTLAGDVASAMAFADAVVSASTPVDAVVSAPTSADNVDDLSAVEAEPTTVDGLDVVAGGSIEEQTLDSSDPGERTWGETPAEFAVAMPVSEEADGTTASDTADEADGPAPDDTQPLPIVGESSLPEEGAETHEVDEAPEEELVPESTADDVAALALLQSGVDLFNVSRVPRKIAETNEQLGMPLVHVYPEDEAVVFTFMWSMGWYSFNVDTESGDARMADRGYDEITDVAANAGVRDDGTVHLAPAQIERAATKQPQAEDAPGEPDRERPPSEPETPSVVAQKPPEILSKSLLGQRSDGEPAAWEQAKARDFDWNR